MLLVRMIQHGWSRLPRRLRLSPSRCLSDGNNSGDRIECSAPALFHLRNPRRVKKGGKQFFFRVEDPKPAKGII